MRTDREYTPTPQELRKTAEAMTMSQKLQFEAIMNMVTALLVSVYQASKSETEAKQNLENRKV